MTSTLLRNRRTTVKSFPIRLIATASRSAISHRSLSFVFLVVGFALPALNAQEPGKTLLGAPLLVQSPIGQNQRPTNPPLPSRDQNPQPSGAYSQDKPPPGLGFDESGNWQPP